MGDKVNGVGTEEVREWKRKIRAGRRGISYGELNGERCEDVRGRMVGRRMDVTERREIRTKWRKIKRKEEE